MWHGVCVRGDSLRQPCALLLLIAIVILVGNWLVNLLQGIFKAMDDAKPFFYQSSLSGTAVKSSRS